MSLSRTPRLAWVEHARPHRAAGRGPPLRSVYVQSTGFVLDPDGRVIVSVYSSGAIRRLVPGDVVGLIRYLRANTAQDAA